MILFGVRSPLVVEVEETCHRLGIAISMAVVVSGAPRCLERRSIVDLAEMPQPEPGERFIACAFSPRRRAELIARAIALGLVPTEALIDPHAVLARSVRVGEASFLNAGVVVGAVTAIGSGVLINRAASVGHHCMIGDNVSIGPGATLAGNIQVGDGAMIGAGAVVLPDTRIGVGAVIAGGSLVRKHVPDGGFAVGNPAQLRRFDAGRSSLNIAGGE